PSTKPSSSTQADPSSVQPLNAANLEQQQQAIKMEKEQVPVQKLQGRGSQVPAAPTVSQPPFQIGAASPLRVPAYAPSVGLPPETLKIPPSKKPRRDQSGSATSTPVPKSAPAPIVSPQTTGNASLNPVKHEGIKSEFTPTFNCPNPECEFHVKGFTSQQELARHKAEAHEPNIADPLGYALEG